MTRESRKFRGHNTRERIISLIEDNEASYKAFEEKFCLKPGTVTEWKRGRVFSYMDYLVEIADEYDTTTDWLLGRVENDSPDLLWVLIAGTISAGRKIEKYEHELEYVKLPSESNPSGRLIGYRVIGDSFMPVAMNNDILIIDKRADKQSNKLCLVTFDNETTIRRIKLTKDLVTIIPINPMESEIHLNNTKALKRGFFIEGTVYKLIRDF